METEKKKAYLQQYKNLKKQCQRLEEEWRYLQREEEEFCSSMVWIGEEEAFRQWKKQMEDLKQEIIRQRYERIHIYEEIRKQIEGLKDETEREVLTYRYLCGFTWEEIAERMHYTFQHVHRIHREALTKFRYEIECDIQDRVESVV